MTPEMLSALVALVLGVVLAVTLGLVVARQGRLRRSLGHARADVQALEARVATLSERLIAAESEAHPGQELALIYNPVKSGVDEIRAYVETQARRDGFGDVLVLETEEDDPGVQMARDAVAAGVRRILVAGGDGTVRTVAEELANTSVALGIIPLGTGNLLARNLSLPINDPEECVRIALHGHQRVIDTVDVRLVHEDGERTRHTFTVMGGAGYDADIMGDTRDDLKDMAGWLAYSEAGLRHLGGERREVSVALDGGPFRTFRMRSVLVANCGMLTAGMELLPEAKLDDGLLDVLILSPRNTLDWARIALKTLTRHRRDLDTLQTRQATRVQVRFAEPTLSQLDGDATGGITGLDARVQPDSLVIMIKNEDRASVQS